MKKLIDKDYICFSDLKKLINRMWKIIKSANFKKIDELPKILEKIRTQEHIKIDVSKSQNNVYFEVRHLLFPSSWTISINDGRASLRYFVIMNGEIDKMEILYNESILLNDKWFKELMKVLK